MNTAADLCFKMSFDEFLRIMERTFNYWLVFSQQLVFWFLTTFSLKSQA